MSEACDGREVVGMDLHRRRSVLVRMSPDGRKLETARITNSPAELRRVIARAGKHPRVVLEATYGWYWAADTLAAGGRGCTCAETMMLSVPASHPELGWPVCKVPGCDGMAETRQGAAGVRRVR
jgi:hypothetical protein